MTITPEQCRAARSMISLKQEELCEVANITHKTLVDFEGGKTKPYARTLVAIRDALEKAGVTFIDDGAASPDGGPGVRLNKN